MKLCLPLFQILSPDFTGFRQIAGQRAGRLMRYIVKTFHASRRV
jgi:hypothetical protein